MSTSTPPPYFPQNTLSPRDARTRRKIKFIFFGCLFLLLAAIAGAIWGIVYLVRQS